MMESEGHTGRARIEYKVAEVTLFPTSFQQRVGQIEGGARSPTPGKIKDLFSVGRLQNLVTLHEPEPESYVEQDAIFAGYSIHQFGHFITESLGRLPFVSEYFSSVPIVFLSGGPRSNRMSPWQRDILTHFGISNKVILLSEPVRFHRLILPKLRFHLNLKTFGDADGRLWMQSRFPPQTEEPYKKLYISRSKLPERMGRYLDEAYIEHALERYGYDIVHPQELPISAQIEMYRSASKILVAESSALHLINMVCSEHQKIAVIQRRPKLHRTLVKAVKYAAKANVSAIDVVQKFYSPGSGKPNPYRGISVLNIPVLGQVLARLGFIEGDGTGFVSPREIMENQDDLVGFQEVELPPERSVVKYLNY